MLGLLRMGPRVCSFAVAVLSSLALAMPFYNYGISGVIYTLTGLSTTQPTMNSRHRHKPHPEESTHVNKAKKVENPQYAKSNQPASPMPNAKE